MIKHHGIGSAGHPYDGADWDNSRGHREHRAGAAGAVPAVGCGGPGGVGRRLGGGGYVNWDRSIAGRPVRQGPVAGIDRGAGKGSDIAAWGSARSEGGGAAQGGGGSGANGGGG